jgi:hypothetical protein
VLLPPTPDWVEETKETVDEADAPAPTPASPAAEAPSPELPLDAPKGIELKGFQRETKSDGESLPNLLSLGKDGFEFMPAERRKPDEPGDDGREKKLFAPLKPRILIFFN